MIKLRHQGKGFTLIELMIVVTIIAILAGIGIPSYREYVRRTARTEAQTALLQNAQFLEQNFTVANSYSKDGGGADIDSSSLPVQNTPKSGTAKYTITLDEDSLTATSYKLMATPVDSDRCGTFTLDQTGAKDVEENTATKTQCWK